MKSNDQSLHQTQCGSVAKGASGCPAGAVEWDVTDIVDHWSSTDSSGTPTNFGFRINAASEVSGGGWRSYRSANEASDKPKLIVTTPGSTDGTDGLDAGDRKFYRYITEELTDRVTAKANVGNGNLYVEAKDATLAGVAGLDLNLTRYYNSSIRVSGKDDSKLGPGWSSSLGGSVRLEFPKANNSQVRFYGPGGYRDTFNQSGSNYTRNTPANEGKLTLDAANNQFKLRMKNKTVYVFRDSSSSPKADGQLLFMRDKNGNELTYTYTSSSDTGLNGTLSSVTDTRGRKAVMTYTGSGADVRLNQIQTRKADGTALVTYNYTYSGSAKQLASSQVSSYNTSALPETEDNNTKNVGKTTTYTYDSNRQLIEIKDARENASTSGAGGTAQFAYDLSSYKVTSIKRVTGDTNVPDPTTTLAYFDSVTDTKCNNYDSTTKRTQVDGKRTDVVDDTVYCADTHSRVRKTIDAKERIRTTKFDASSNVEKFDDSGLGSDTSQTQTTMTYDGEDNPTTATTPSQSKASATYGDSNSPNVPTAMRDFDTGGDPSKPATWNYDYDNAGNLIEAKADVANGKMVRYRYCWDANGQLQRTDPIDAAGNNSVALDESATLGCGTADQGNDTLRSYDSLGQLTTVDPPGTRGTLSFTYDALSRIKTTTDGRGVVITYTYDVYDRVVRQRFDATNATGVSGPAITTVQWTYDEAGNMTALSDPTGGEQFTFDELNRRTQQITGGTVTKAYTYDTADNLLSQNIAGDPAPTVYTYDKLNLVETVDDPRSTTNIVSFKYDRRDKRVRTIFPMDSGGDLVQRAKIDNDGRVTCMYSYRSGSGIADGDEADCPAATANGLITFREYDYTKTVSTPVGNAQIQTQTRYGIKEKGGVNTKLEYDPISRLTSATTSAGNDDRLRKFDYTYDRHSNTTKMEIAGRTSGTNHTPGLRVGTLHMGYAANDELCWSGSTAPSSSTDCTSTPTGATTYSYDGVGALTGNSSGLALQYNGVGQNSAVDPAGSSPLFSMTYTGTTQDRRQTKGGASYSYGFAGLTSDSAAAGDSWYVRTPDGKLVSQILRNGATTDVRYYLTDAQDSVIATVKPAGETRRYLYEPYGEQIRSWIDASPGANSNGSGTPPDGSESTPTAADNAADSNPWRFASGYLDSATNWLKFGTRYYDSGLGRWTQTDPKAATPQRPLTNNPYLYTDSNPTNRTDIRGRDWLGDTMDWFESDTGTDFLGGLAFAAGLAIVAPLLPISGLAVFAIGAAVELAIAVEDE